MRNLVELIATSAARAPRAEALVDGDRRLDYATLLQRVLAASSGLRRRGLARGDRVGLLLDKRLETVEALFAIAAAGGICVPINPLLKPEFVGMNPSFAQNSVKLYGLINAGVGAYQLAGAGRIRGVSSGDMSTSFWGVSGTEDLGGGLKAQFALESFVGVDTGAAGRFSGDAMFAKNAYAGLSGDFGQVRIGRNTSQMFVSLLLFNSFGDSFGFSPTLLHYYLDGRDIPISKTTRLQNDTAWRNSVSYLSPMMSGFKVNLQAAAGEGIGKSSYAGTVVYFGDPFSATLAYQSVGTDAAAPTNGRREKTINLGAAYDFRAIKVYAQYGEIDDDSYGSKLRLYDISAEVPVNGQGKILAAWGHSKVRTGTFAGILPLFAGNTHKTFSLGYDHSLSKRTDLYAVYMNDRVDGLRAGNSVAAGLRHTF